MVLILNTQDLTSFDFAEKINNNHKLYSHKNNYEYQSSKNNSSILECLNKHDYILVINSMSIFINLDIKITSFINLEDHLFLSLVTNTKRISRTNMNDRILSDSFIIKNTLWSYEFLSSWISSKTSIQDFILKNITIDYSIEDKIQNISWLNQDFQVFMPDIIQNPKKSSECFLLNLFGLNADTSNKTIFSLNSKLGIL